jgi:hypothetical protein
VSIIAHKKRRPRKSECHEELGPFTQARRRIRFSPKRMEREGTGKENEEEQAGSDESTPSGKDEQAADQEHEARGNGDRARSRHVLALKVPNHLPGAEEMVQAEHDEEE